MKQFAEWFVSFFDMLINHLWNLIKGFFIGLYDLVIGNPIIYAKYFIDSSATFNPLDWVLGIIFIIVYVVLVAMIIMLLVQLVRRYVVFSRVEQDKRELLFQNNLLERKLRNIGYKEPSKKLNGNHQTNGHKDQTSDTKRFTKLSLIDETYKYTKLPTFMKEEEKLTLAQIVNAFREFAANKLKLYYDHQTIATFIAGMGTSKLMILEGISGTGKTSLPYAFSKFVSNEATIIPVQPSWRDRYEMMGYLNDFTKKFNETEFLRALYEATYRSDVNFIVLDEMNLARVEYYFADFLALLELPNSDEWLIEVVPEQLIGDPANLKGGKLKIPTNVWFVGTANKDDSTFGITDKVYDRAASIEMNYKAAYFESRNVSSMNLSYEYLKGLFDEALTKYQISQVSLDAIEKLDAFISKNFEITFGNRIMKQFKTFIPLFIACGMEEMVGIDYLISRKIIRKFETLNLPFLKDELKQLLTTFDDLFGKDKLTTSKEIITRYISKY